MNAPGWLQRDASGEPTEKTWSDYLADAATEFDGQYGNYERPCYDDEGDYE